MKAKLKIDNTLYGSRLSNHIVEIYYQDPAQHSFLMLLDKLVGLRQHLFTKDYLNQQFSAADLDVLGNTELLSTIDNKEIRARWLDVLISLDPKFLIKHIREVYECYRHVYDATKNFFYLVRGLELVARAKSALRDSLEEIFAEGTKAIQTAESSHLQNLLVQQMVAVFGKIKCSEAFDTFFQDEISRHVANHTFDDARDCVDSLSLLGVLSKNAAKIKKAELLEMEGDYMRSQRKEDVHQWRLADNYLEGVREIASVPNANELRDRLKEKAEKELEANAKIILMHGVPLHPPIDVKHIRRFVSRLKISSFYEGFKEMMAVPFPQTKYFRDDTLDGGDFLNTFMEGYTKISPKGARIAKQKIKEGSVTLKRMHCREIILCYIRNLKIRMDIWGEVSTELIDRILLRLNSPFIPPKRRWLFTQGLAEGFRGDYVKAAHLLIPQIENSCRYLGNANGILSTRLEKDLQHENMFAATVTSIHPIANHEFIEELKSFFSDGNDMNFRNEVLHGLADLNQVYKYGQYVWWLVLKILYNINDLFPGIQKPEIGKTN